MYISMVRWFINKVIPTIIVITKQVRLQIFIFNVEIFIIYLLSRSFRVRIKGHVFF